jgi:hypothetical protein
MPHPPPRQHRIVGSVHPVLDSRTASHGAPARHIDTGRMEAGRVDAARIDTGFTASAPARRVRTTDAENPFASFYESRRKISLETDDDDISDPSSSITRAYIVPDALLAVARGERDASVDNILVDAGPGGDGSTALVRFVATNPVDVATESTSMFRFRSSPILGFATEWRTVQRIALQMAGWLRRTWRRSVPN